MKSTSTLGAAAVLLAAPGVYAGLINYPPIPEDLTTPFQQRLAVYGPGGRELLFDLQIPMANMK